LAFDVIITNLSGNKDWGHIFWMPGVLAGGTLLAFPVNYWDVTKPFSLMIVCLQTLQDIL
jgi:hypothetical protein